MNQLDEGCKDMTMVEFLDRQVALDGIECRTEVDEG